MTRTAVSLTPDEVCSIAAISPETYANPSHVVDMEAEAAAALPRASRTSGAPYLAPYARENTPAVLDIKWRPVPVPEGESGAGESTFMAAFGDGTVRLYSASLPPSPSLSSPTLTSSSSDHPSAHPALSTTPEDASSPPVGPAPVRGVAELWRLRACALTESAPALALALDWGERPARPCEDDDYDDYNDDDNDDDDGNGEGKKKEEKLVPVAAVSFSSGVVGIIDLPPPPSPSASASTSSSSTPRAHARGTVRHLWRAHDSEAWIVALDPHPTDSRFGRWAYSGGDDCLLKIWDERMLPLCPLPESLTDNDNDDNDNLDDEPGGDGCDPAPSRSVPSVATLRAHTGGVVAIRPHPTNPCLLASGGYDDCLLLWDKRNLAAPLAQWQSGGGVWRIRWRPVNGGDVLSGRGQGKRLGFEEAVADAETACVVNMYNGMHIVRAKGIFLPPVSTNGVSDDEAELMRHLASDVALASQQSTDSSNGVSFEVSSSYHQCGSKTILYGGDWVHGDTRRLFSGMSEETRAPAVIAGCSFYNKRVALWSPADEINQ